MQLDAVVLLMVAGLALPIVVGLLYGISVIKGSIEQLRKKAEARRRRREAISRLPEVVRLSLETKRSLDKTDRWSSMVASRIEQSGLPINVTVFMAGLVFLVGVGLVIGLLLLKNILMAVALVVNLVLLPFLLLKWGWQKQYQRMMEQMAIAMQLFAVEYELNKSIESALRKCAGSVGNPLRKILESCANDLVASKPPKEVFQRLANKLPGEQGRIWAQTLLMSVENSATMRLLPRILMTVNGLRLLQQKNALELSGSRRLGLIINMLVPPGFAATLMFLPDAIRFYESIFGRLAIVLVFASVTVGILLDQLLRRVDL